MPSETETVDRLISRTPMAIPLMYRTTSGRLVSLASEGYLFGDSEIVIVRIFPVDELDGDPVVTGAGLDIHAVA